MRAAVESVVEAAASTLWVDMLFTLAEGLE